MNDLNKKLSGLIKKYNLTKVEIQKASGLNKRKLEYRLNGNTLFTREEVNKINKLLKEKYTLDYLSETICISFVGKADEWTDESLKFYSERLSYLYSSASLSRSILEERLGLDKGTIKNTFRRKDTEEAEKLLKEIEASLDTYYCLTKPEPLKEETSDKDTDKVEVEEKSIPINLDGTPNTYGEVRVDIRSVSKGIMDIFPFSLVKSLFKYIRGWS